MKAHHQHKISLDTLDSSELMQFVSRIANGANGTNALPIKIKKTSHRQHTKQHKPRAPKKLPTTPAPTPTATPNEELDVEEFLAEMSKISDEDVDAASTSSSPPQHTEFSSPTLTSPQPQPPLDKIAQEQINATMIGMATITAGMEDSSQPFEVRLRNALAQKQECDMAQIDHGQIPDSAQYIYSIESQITNPTVRAAIDIVSHNHSVSSSHQQLAIANKQMLQITDGLTPLKTDAYLVTAVSQSMEVGQINKGTNVAMAMDIIGRSPEVIKLYENGAELRRVAGKTVIIQDPHNTMSGEMRYARHVCKPGCVYVAIIDTVETDVQCRTITDRLRLDGIIIDDPKLDPDIDHIWMCTIGGTFHDCREHTCCDSVPTDGSFVCWKSGQVYGQDICMTNPDQYSTDNNGRSGDGTGWHMSGWAATQMDNTARSYANARRSKISKTAGLAHEHVMQMMSPLTNAPWVIAAQEARKRLNRIRNNVSHTMVKDKNNQLEIQMHRPVHRGKLSGEVAMSQVLAICTPSPPPPINGTQHQQQSTDIRSSAEAQWEDGPADQRRHGACAADKRHVRETVRVDDADAVASASSTTTTHIELVENGLCKILDVKWLAAVVETFDAEAYCLPYIELANLNTLTKDSALYAMSKAADFAIQEIAVAIQMVKFMFVTLPWQYSHLKTTTLMNDLEDQNPNNRLTELRDMIVRKYTSVVMKCWIMISAARRVGRETNIMLADLNQYCRLQTQFCTTPTTPIAPPTPSVSPLGMAMLTLSLSSVQPLTQLLLTAPPTLPPLPALPKFSQCTLGVLYLTANGYKVPANFADIQFPPALQLELLSLLGIMDIDMFASNHEMLFISLDRLAGSKLVPETGLAKVCRDAHVKLTPFPKPTQLQSSSTTPTNRKRPHKMVNKTDNLPTRIDCRSATAGRSVVQDRLREIAIWSMVKLMHDIVIKGYDATTATAMFDKRTACFALNSSI